MIPKRFSTSLAAAIVLIVAALSVGHGTRADEKKPAAKKDQKPAASSDQVAADRSKALEKAADTSQITVSEGTTAGAIRGDTAAQPPATTKPLTLPELTRIGVR